MKKRLKFPRYSVVAESINPRGLARSLWWSVGLIHSQLLGGDETVDSVV